MYLTVDSFIDIKNIITGSNNVTSNKVNVKIWGYNKMYMDKDLMEDNLHELIDESNEKKKLITGIFISHFSAIYIRFMMKCENL